MSGPSRVPGARQAARRGDPSDPSRERPIVLARLFSLGAPGGRDVDLRPLRAALTAAQLALDALRFAAEDAVAAEPIMPEDAQRADVQARGAELAEHLIAARVEVDVLAEVLRGGACHVA
jgi:hypothetical protein